MIPSSIDPREVQPEIAKAIEHWASLLHVPAGLNPVALMRAICENETSGGARAFATLHEPAYCYGGRYFNSDLAQLSVPWGCLAHSSFGPWQILFVTAHEHGYSGDPVGLRDPQTSAEYVVKILNRRLFDQVADATPEDAFDAWNSGRARDANVPAKYISEGMDHYVRFIEGGTSA